jgi:hypothetical protein
MAWIKKGLIFSPDARTPWIASHAQVPTVLVKQDFIRSYFAGRDAQGKSSTSYVDLDRDDPQRVLRISRGPVLTMGKPGTFDDDGVMPSDVVPVGNRLYLYYSGWNQRTRVPYHNSTGLAVSDDGGESFTRMFEGPIMDRTPEEPYIAVTPCVLREGSLWRMWYISGVRWEEVHGKYEPIYVIKYAQSTDGIRWERPNVLCVEQRHELEAFSRPWAIKSSGTYRMWFCCRDSRDYRDGAGSYRMGYAESSDGLRWKRMDRHSGIDVSAEGWDSKMVCYPNVVELGGRLYLFYNGNGHGRSGFGYAMWSD